MAIQTQGEVQKAGSSAWEPLFAWREGSSLVVEPPASWPNGTTRFRTRRRDTATGLVSDWGPTRTITLAIVAPVSDPVFTLDGIPVPLERGSFRELPDEVNQVTGATYRNWGASAYFGDPADADMVRALRSWNLRRAIGGQLRGRGHGDVVAGGLILAGQSVTVRLEVETGAYPAPGPQGWHRSLALRLREQVTS